MDVSDIYEPINALLECGIPLDTAEDIIFEKGIVRNIDIDEFSNVLDDLDKKVKTERNSIASQLYGYLVYKIPLEDAKSSILEHEPRTYTEIEDYERFDSWGGELPLPKVDDDMYRTLPPTDTSSDLLSIGNELQRGISHVVYFLICDVLGESARIAERRANRLFTTNTGWVKEAYCSDMAIYIGQTRSLSTRLKTHSVGTMKDSKKPARLSALSDIKAVGVISGAKGREKAKEIEALYAENLQDVVSDDYFVYYA